MSLLELQKEITGKLLDRMPAAGAMAVTRDVVLKKRRRQLARTCPWSYPRIPIDVVRDFFELYRADDPDPEVEARDFLKFAADRVETVTRDIVRFERIVRWPERIEMQVFSIDVRYVEQGKVIVTGPRHWLLAPGIRPVPLWRARAEEDFGG